MKVPGHYPYAGEVRLNATGTKGYLTTNSGTVQVFDATTNTMTTAIPAAHPESLAFSPDGSKVYILSYDGITVVDAMTDTIIDAWDLPEYDESVILNIDPTGNYGYLASPRKHLLQVIDLRTGSIVGTLALGGPPGSITLTEDGRTLYVTDGYNDRINVVDTATLSITMRFSVRTGWQFLLSKAEGRAFIADPSQSRINVVDLTTNALICSHAFFPLHLNSPGRMSLSPDGKKLYVVQNSHPNDKITVIPLPQERNVTFPDAPAGTQFEREIRWMGNAGIATGYSDGNYRPLEPVRRDAMAAFLYRFLGSPDFQPPTTSPFVDVKPGDQFYKEITWLASEGISTGWPDGTYRPLAEIKRDAMAAFMFRSLPSTNNFQEPASSPFADVRTTDQFYREMALMSALDVTNGWPDGTFRPLQPVNRDAMAAFLFRLAPSAATNIIR